MPVEMRADPAATDRSTPGVSIVVPLRDEAATLPRLIAEIEDAVVGRLSCEVVCVDDGSVDGTAEAVVAQMVHRPWLRLIRHGSPCGKSAGLWTGVHAARAPVVATMNGDGRSDPAIIPRMVAELRDAGPDCGLVAAQRLGRHDTALQRFRSKLGSLARQAVLADEVRDAHCGLKCFPRDVFLELPYFDGLHRFLPAIIRSDGYAISLIDVVDRPAWHGKPRPGLLQGIWRHFVDILGVNWLIHRRRHLPVPSEAAVPAPGDRTSE